MPLTFGTKLGAREIVGPLGAGVEHIITMCLQKNPDDRCLVAHDIKLELQWIASEETAPLLTTTATAARQQRSTLLSDWSCPDSNLRTIT